MIKPLLERKIALMSLTPSNVLVVLPKGTEQTQDIASLAASEFRLISIRHSLYDDSVPFSDPDQLEAIASAVTKSLTDCWREESTKTRCGEVQLEGHLYFLPGGEGRSTAAQVQY